MAADAAVAAARASFIPRARWSPIICSYWPTVSAVVPWPCIRRPPVLIEPRSGSLLTSTTTAFSSCHSPLDTSGYSTEFQKIR